MFQFLWGKNVLYSIFNFFVCLERCVFLETVGVWADTQLGHGDEGQRRW